MPNFDGTGPRGLGPKTGRKAGNCSPSNSTKIPTRLKGVGNGPKDGTGIRAHARFGRGKCLDE